jgi:hypothetical protein
MSNTPRRHRPPAPYEPSTAGQRAAHDFATKRATEHERPLVKYTIAGRTVTASEFTKWESAKFAAAHPPGAHSIEGD